MKNLILSYSFSVCDWRWQNTGSPKKVVFSKAYNFFLRWVIIVWKEPFFWDTLYFVFSWTNWAKTIAENQVFTHSAPTATNDFLFQKYLYFPKSCYSEKEHVLRQLCLENAKESCFYVESVHFMLWSKWVTSKYRWTEASVASVLSFVLMSCQSKMTSVLDENGVRVHVTSSR